MLRAEAWAFRGGLAVVVLAPLPLGANRPWAWEALALVFAALSLVQAAATARGSVRAIADVPAGPAALWAVVLAWASLQVAGLAPPVRPDLWAEVAVALDRPVQPRAVLNVEAATAGLLRLLTYTAAFWLFAQWGASRRRAALAVAVVGWSGAAWAVVGLVLLSGGDRLPFGEKAAHLGFATGPFPNRNTLALWLGMALCALAAAGVQRQAWRSLSRGWPWWLGAATTVAALAATQSRAGVVAAAVGLGVTLARLARPSLAVVAVTLAVLAVAASPFSVRLAATILDPSVLPRLTVWAATMRGLSQAPWTGIGLGSFPDAFAELRPRALLQPWHYAHNTYLELAWELGLPVALTAVTALGWLGVRLLRVPSLTAAAGAGALAAASLHAMADFSPQVPAVALLLAAMIGLAWGRVASRVAGTGPVAGPARPGRGRAGRSPPDRTQPNGRAVCQRIGQGLPDPARAAAAPAQTPAIQPPPGEGG